MKNREAIVLIINSTVSSDISRSNFTPTRAITYIYISDFHYLPLIESRSLSSLTNNIGIRVIPYY